MTCCGKNENKGLQNCHKQTKRLFDVSEKGTPFRSILKVKISASSKLFCEFEDECLFDKKKLHEEVLLVFSRIYLPIFTWY